LLIGLISDTHGVVRPGVHAALAGVDVILHAGDVGGDEVLAELAVIAPVFAVRGNTDPVDAPGLVDRIDTSFDGVRIHVSHGHEIGAPRPGALLAAYPDADVIVHGHTHTRVAHRAADGRLVVNPGAAGENTRDPTASVARLTCISGRATLEFVDL
jgi:putative phosphoesterase